MKQQIQLILAIIGTGMGLVWAGDLNPSMPPTTGTMKTLTEVEPRIAINDDNTPGDANYAYKITQSGSYYLTADVVTDVRGMSIGADNVTIDLNGYTLRHTGTGSHWGILMYGYDNIEIRNGTIEGFDQALYDNATGGGGRRIRSIRVLNSKKYAIMITVSGVVIEDCFIHDNGADNSASAAFGIMCGDKAVVRNNYISDTGTNALNYVYGVKVGVGSIVTGNTIRDNAAFASNYFYGIWADAGSLITGNLCYHNASNANDKTKDIYGIKAEAGSVIKENVVYDTGTGADGTAYGISAGAYCVISNNACYLNKDYNLSYSTGCVLDQNVAP